MIITMLNRNNHGSTVGAMLASPVVGRIKLCKVYALRERMLERGKSKMAAVAAAMRKLLHIVYGVIKSNRPFDPKLTMPTNNSS